MSTDALVAFLAQRLDEEEQLAQSAKGDTDGRWARLCWHEDDPDEEVPPLAEDDCCVIEGDGIRIYDEGGHDAEQAEHIARHDPARVLADVRAKRAILAQYVTDLEAGIFTSAVEDARTDRMEYVVHLLTSAYADHEAFDPAWAVDVSPAATIRLLPRKAEP